MLGSGYSVCLAALFNEEVFSPLELSFCATSQTLSDRKIIGHFLWNRGAPGTGGVLSEPGQRLTVVPTGVPPRVLVLLPTQVLPSGPSPTHSTSVRTGRNVTGKTQNLRRRKVKQNGQLLPELFCYQMEMQACFALVFF